MDREELGRLWLRWYVHRSDPRQPFERIWDMVEDAQQLQVRDLAEDERAWEAMSQADPNAPDRSHVKTIEQYEARYRGSGGVVFIVPAWSVAEGFVMIEGAHRASALYRLDLSRLDVDLIVLDAGPDCPDVQPEPRAQCLADARSDPS